jgi:hypothetical protein
MSAPLEPPYSFGTQTPFQLQATVARTQRFQTPAGEAAQARKIYCLSSAIQGMIKGAPQCIYSANHFKRVDLVESESQAKYVRLGKLLSLGERVLVHGLHSSVQCMHRALREALKTSRKFSRGKALSCVIHNSWVRQGLCH